MTIRKNTDPLHSELFVKMNYSWRKRFDVAHLNSPAGVVAIGTRKADLRITADSPSSLIITA